MDKEEVLLVQSSWRQISNRQDEIGSKFYERLFEEAPQLKNLFSSDKEKQGEKLMRAIGLHVTKLEMDENLPDEMMQTLGKRHAAYGVKAEYFGKFGEVLIKTMRDTLDDAIWTPKLEAAWKKAFQKLSNMIIKTGNL